MKNPAVAMERRTWFDKVMSKVTAKAADASYDEPQQQQPSALQLYLSAFSLRFQGLRKHTALSSQGSCAQVPEFFDVFAQASPQLAIDMWFSLSGDNDGNGETHASGILVGAQSSSFNDPSWA